MQWHHALKLFEHTLASERDRPDVHAAMLQRADPHTITHVSSQIQQALAQGERVWMTSDLHIGHANIIRHCDRPFESVGGMNEHLVTQLSKVPDAEWLLIVGDLAMGPHDVAMQWIRRLPGKKVLVLGNHDLTRNGECRYVDERNAADDGPVFEAIVPFLAWQGCGGQCGQRHLEVFVSHYPVIVPHSMPRLVNYHGHLHRQVLPPTESTHFVNVGWDVNRGIVCL